MIRALRLQYVFTLLQRRGHEAALVGGVAVGARTRERFTKDVDLAVAVGSDAEAEQIVFVLQQQSFTLLDVFEHVPTQSLGTVRFGWPRSRSNDPEPDLLFAACGIETEIVAAATPVEIASGVWIPTASIPHLIAMKILSTSEVRYQDRADLGSLLTVASKSDLDVTRNCLHLIEARGFNRQKDLIADLHSVLESFERR